MDTKGKEYEWKRLVSVFSKNIPSVIENETIFVD